MKMKADYKNWVPKGMIYGLAVGTGVLGAGFAAAFALTKEAPTPVRIGVNAVLGLGTLACGKATQWSVFAYKQFSYNGKRQLSKQIIDGTAEYVNLPDGERGLMSAAGAGPLPLPVRSGTPTLRWWGLTAG